MNIPFVKDKLPPRGRIVCDIAGEIIIALFGLGVMAAGVYGRSAPDGPDGFRLQVSMGIIYGAIPLSGISIVFYFFYNVTALMKEFKNTACSKEEA